MRIAFLVESIDLERGGAERAVMTMAKALETLGQDCAILAPAGRSQVQNSSTAPDGRKGPRILTVTLPKLGRAKRARALGETLSPYARREGYDCLVSCGKMLGGDFHWPHGGVHEATLRASCGAGRSPIHGKVALLAKRLRPVEAVFKDIENSIYSGIHSGQCRAIALSNKVKQDMMAFHKVPESLIQLCPNGAPTHIFPELSWQAMEEKRLRFCEDMGIDKGSQLLFFVAMNPRLKGSVTLSRVMKAAPPEQHLFYIGKKPGHRLSPQEHCLGPRTDVPQLLSIGHALLLPSHYDPCSLVTLEALAAGIPVLTTKHNGAIELLKDKAWLADTEADLLSALKELALDPAQRSRRELAKQVAGQWTAEDAAARFLEILTGR
ncbi:MAG: glycosyltransferase family 4 protein [Planctomycetota bacterium]|nr:glycosyltransferase family 4 protein [Planctomycetota bacterium]